MEPGASARNPELQQVRMTSGQKSRDPSKWDTQCSAVAKIDPHFVFIEPKIIRQMVMPSLPDTV